MATNREKELEKEITILKKEKEDDLIKYEKEKQLKENEC